MNRLTWTLLVAAAPMAAQQTFTTPDDAMQALGKAVRAKDQAALAAIFGPQREKLLTGDPVEDSRNLARFATNFDKYAALEKVNDVKETLLVGEDRWPMPV